MKPYARGKNGRQNFCRLAASWWHIALPFGAVLAWLIWHNPHWNGDSWWWISGLSLSLLALFIRERCCSRTRRRTAAVQPHQGRTEEIEARRLLGVPAHYPERITAELPADQEEWLAEICATTWPHDEYTREIEMFGGGS